MKPKFTSGEWVAEELVTCCIISSEDRVIGESFRAEDAHLIASAPDMYKHISHDVEWLNRMIATHGDDNPMTPMFTQLRDEKIALLAKARGE